MTVEAWVTVRSSGTPRAPTAMPASSSPWIDSSWALARRNVASSELKPVMWATSVAKRASSSVITSAAAVPRHAATDFGPSPCASGIVSSMMASAPIVATASGDEPSRIAGTTKSTTTARLPARPASARTPRQRAVSTTRSANATVSHRSGARRSKSEKA